MRMYAVYHKSEDLSFISHLDVQRTLQRAFRRAGIPLAYSEGFNPHPQLSFAAAVATGTASECEWFEVKLYEDMEPAAFVERTNACMPKGLYLSDASVVPDQAGKLTTLVRSAKYRVKLSDGNGLITPGRVQTAITKLLGGEIFVEKKTKGGLKTVDIRPQVISMDVEGFVDGKVILTVHGQLQCDGGLRTELLLDRLFETMEIPDGTAEICRVRMLFEPGNNLPEAVC